MMKTMNMTSISRSLAVASPLRGPRRRLLKPRNRPPPEPGTPKGFSLPKPTTFTLDNGLGVTLVQYGTVPKATVHLGVRTGNVDEKANEVWLADLIGDMLSEGTATRSAVEDRRGRRAHGRLARRRRRREPHRHRRRRALGVRAGPVSGLGPSPPSWPSRR